MERDLRETPLYQEIEAAYRRVAEPGFGRITAASDVRASPDGGAVAFRGARLDALEGHPSGRICLAAADGSGHRQITHGPGEDSGPRWSPDGATLTFLSDRRERGSAQLYALAAGELGEARRLAEAPGIVEHHEWSPDGTRILLLVAGHGAEQTDALGSGTLGPEAELPAWMPQVDSNESDGEGPAGAVRARRRERRAHARLARRAERVGGDLVRRRRGRGDRLGRRGRRRLVRRRARTDRSRRAHRAHAAADRRAARLGLRLPGRLARGGDRDRLQRSRDRGR